MKPQDWNKPQQRSERLRFFLYEFYQASSSNAYTIGVEQTLACPNNIDTSMEVHRNLDEFGLWSLEVEPIRSREQLKYIYLLVVTIET